MGTFSSVLGAIERKRGLTALKYDGVPDTEFEDICYSSVFDLLAVLDERLELARFNIKAATEWLAQPRPKGLKAEDRKEEVQARIRARFILKRFPAVIVGLEKLQKEVEKDIYDPYLGYENTPIPVCLSARPDIMQHEMVHAAFRRMIPAAGLNTHAAHNARSLVLMKATWRFMNALGPKSRDLFLMAFPNVPSTHHIEEIIAGVGGLVYTYAKEREGVDVKKSKKKLLAGFYSYIGKSPTVEAMTPTQRNKFFKDFLTLAWGSAKEWYDKYGNDFYAAMGALAPLVREELRNSPKSSKVKDPYGAVKAAAKKRAEARKGP